MASPLLMSILSTDSEGYETNIHGISGRDLDDIHIRASIALSLSYSDATSFRSRVMAFDIIPLFTLVDLVLSFQFRGWKKGSKKESPTGWVVP